MDETRIWTVISLLALTTFLLRYSFLGLIGSRPMPEWLLRHLRYTPVAVLPALIAPLVVWPAATGGHTDPARMLAATATVIAGLITRSALWSIFAGAATLSIALRLIG